MDSIAPFQPEDPDLKRGAAAIAAVHGGTLKTVYNALEDRIPPLDCAYKVRNVWYMRVSRYQQRVQQLEDEAIAAAAKARGIGAHQSAAE
jgi:hypothetical protein